MCKGLKFIDMYNNTKNITISEQWIPKENARSEVNTSEYNSKKVLTL